MSKHSLRDVGSLLRVLRENAGFTQDALARASRCSKAYLSLVESGQRTLSIERAAAIEAALDIHDGRLQAALNWQRVPEVLLAQLQRSQSYSAEMTRRLRDAMDSDDPVASLREMIELDVAHEAHEADDVADVSSSSSRNRSTKSIAPVFPAFGGSMWGAGRAIPIINKVAAGYPREFTDMDAPAPRRSVGIGNGVCGAGSGVGAGRGVSVFADDCVVCPDDSDPDAFAARVVGDSMEPEYFEGDVVVFSPEAKVAPPAGAGVDCFVRFERDGESTFKRAYFDEGGGSIRLQPLNSAYPPRTVSREEVAGLYAAVYVLRKVKREGVR